MQVLSKYIYDLFDMCGAQGRFVKRNNKYHGRICITSKLGKTIHVLSIIKSFDNPYDAVKSAYEIAADDLSLDYIKCIEKS